MNKTIQSQKRQLRDERIPRSVATNKACVMMALVFLSLLQLETCKAFAPRTLNPAFQPAQRHSTSKPLQVAEVVSAVGEASQSLAVSDLASPLSGLTAISTAINGFFQSDPYLASFLTCSVKASAADMIAQQQEDNNSDEVSNDSLASATSNADASSEMDLSRNLGFLLYGGLYTGIAQNFLYTVLFPAWFGSEETWEVIVRQVLADNLIFGPLVCLPIGYTFKTAFTSEDGLTSSTLRDGLLKYKEDVLERGLLTKYWSIWVPVQFLTFSVIPYHFRVVFVALVSFFWFFILSTVSSSEDEVASKD